jgi:hypothetical protein
LFPDFRVGVRIFPSPQLKFIDLSAPKMTSYIKLVSKWGILFCISLNIFALAVVSTFALVLKGVSKSTYNHQTNNGKNVHGGCVSEKDSPDGEGCLSEYPGTLNQSMTATFFFSGGLSLLIAITFAIVILAALRGGSKVSYSP